MLPNVPDGSQIIIESDATWYVYRVTSQAVVDEHRTDVIEPNAAGAARGITLTTCWPVFSLKPATRRYIVHGAFMGWLPVSDGVPAALAQSHRTVSQSITHGVATIASKTGMHITDVLAVALGLMWLIMDAMAWLFWHACMHVARRLRTLSIPALLRRLQAGPVGHGRIARWVEPIVRAVLLAILLSVLLLTSWRWLCPWLADTVPFLASPHPTLG